MNNDNVFDLLIAGFFAISPQLGVLGLKAQYLVISFRLGEGETLPRLRLRAIQIRSEIFLLQYETGQINNLTSKYIMELSKFNT